MTKSTAVYLIWIPFPGQSVKLVLGVPKIMKACLLSRKERIVSNTARKLEKLSTKARIQSKSLADLYQKATEQQKFISHRPSLQPISPADRYWLTSTFGYRSDPFTGAKRMHAGLDMAGNTGLSIYATGDGTVVSAHFNAYGYGREIEIDHGFGYTTVYGHLSKILVKKGDRIKRGQLIGELGSTGRSTGPHLHYEVRYNDKADQSPVLLLRKFVSRRIRGNYRSGK